MTTYTVIDRNPTKFIPASSETNQVYYPKSCEEITTSLEQLLDSEKFIFTNDFKLYNALDLDERRYQIVQLTVDDEDYSEERGGIWTTQIKNAKVIN